MKDKVLVPTVVLDVGAMHELRDVLRFIERAAGNFPDATISLESLEGLSQLGDALWDCYVAVRKLEGASIEVIGVKPPAVSS